MTFIAPLGTLHNKCPAKPHFVAEKKINVKIISIKFDKVISINHYFFAKFNLLYGRVSSEDEKRVCSH